MGGGGDGRGCYGSGRVGEIRDMVEVGNGAEGAMSGRDGMIDGLEGRVWLRVAEDVARVGTGGASVYGAGVEGAVVWGKREDVLLFKVI